MAAGRRREERQRVLEQAAWIGALLGNLATPYAVDQYLRNGALPDGSERQMPYFPEVDAKVAQIVKDGGKLIV